MQYWSRTGSLIEFVGFLIICSLSGIGGWWIVGAGFYLKARERLIAGLATGFILYIELSNLFAHVLSLSFAYWLSAFLLLLVGFGLALRSGRPAWFKVRIRETWTQIAVLSVVILVFILILAGLGIFDDYYHLPLISVMATGDIPPHFYLDPILNLPYHYGLQVFAASMVRVGGLFPWSAWDVSRAVVIGFAVLLGWLWIYRMTSSKLAGALGAILILFGGGARWLLLFFPSSVLNHLGANLNMDLGGLRAGGTLLANLTSSWPMDGGGPFPFPFAYANGLLEPLNMSLGATGALWEMTILLLLLLSRRRRPSVIASVILGLLIASLALSAEQVFAIVIAGLVLSIALEILSRAIRRLPFQAEPLLQWSVPIILSSLLALFQGGYITGAFMNLAARLTGQQYPVMTTDFQSFSFRWPFAVPTGHFGPLSLFDPAQIVILLAEAGPALFLMPLVIGYWIRKPHKINRLPQGIAIGSVLSFAIPIFVRYGLDFDITRLVGAALFLWYVLSFPVIWRWLKHAGQGFRLLVGAGYGIAIYAGIVMFAVELVAMPVPQATYYINYKEAATFSRIYWDRLEKGAQVLDSTPQRAITLFGRASFAGTELYVHSPVWEALIADPDPVKVAKQGYSYIYMNNAWWKRLSSQQQTAYSLPCIRLVDQVKLADNGFRKLLDVKACRP
ncbi:MAG: hypothetical protein ACM3PY_16160 [Omnitrophica WOR_2 bacterium]